MTSEVAVLNRLAVALAADSAVTTPYQKVHHSADKLFKLSDHEPVGIMVYSNANLMTMPWETLVHDFRKTLGPQAYPRLEHYSFAFFAYLKGIIRSFDAKTQRDHFLQVVDAHFSAIAAEIEAQVHDLEMEYKEKGTGRGRSKKRGEIHREVIGHKLRELTSTKRTQALPPGIGRDMVDAYRPAIDAKIGEIFTGFYPPFGAHEAELLRAYAEELVEAKPIALATLSGIVIAGFGLEDYAPVLQSFEIGDVYGDRLKFRQTKLVRIGDPSKATKLPREACIETFADSETANAFLRGLPADLESEIVRLAYETAEELCDEALSASGLKGGARHKLKKRLANLREEIVLKDFVREIDSVKKEEYEKPSEMALCNLAKEDLAHVAASLVNINMLKKRMSLALETIGGPIDVAVISKGDGFIWIDKKEYFSTSRNHQHLLKTSRP